MDSNGPEVTTQLFHVEEAAKILRIGRTKAYELIATGQLHAIHLGRATRISSRELDRFLRSLDRPEQGVRRVRSAVRPALGQGLLFETASSLRMPDDESGGAIG